MPHAHGGAGENPEELRLFADALCQGGAPLTALTGQGRTGREAWVTFDARGGRVTAELNFTRATGHWYDRTWSTVPAVVREGRAEATLWPGTTVYYFNIVDDCGGVVSSEHVELDSNR